jgi:cytochrome c oxidase assembly protein subunit 15
MIWIGGLVTSTGSGMAVPDWPNTYGYNLFLYPWQTWVYGPWKLFLEHGHRLFGTLVGMIAICFLAAALWTRSRAAVRWLALVALVGVIGQGLLGGVRVRMNEITFAQIHGCVGPAFFAFTVVCAVVTSRRWREATAPTSPGIGRIERLAVIIALLAMLQIVLGSFLRHLPAGARPGQFRLMLWFHLFIAAGLWAHISLITFRVWRDFRQERWLRAPATRLALLVVLQVLLGLGTWVAKYGFPGWMSSFAFAAAYRPTADSTGQVSMATAHVAIGSLILATSALLAMRAWRLHSLASPASAQAETPRRTTNTSQLLMEVAR